MNDVIIKSKQTYVINLSQSQPRYLHCMFSILNCKPRVPIETYSQPFPWRLCNLSSESTIIDFGARLCNIQRNFCFTYYWFSGTKVTRVLLGERIKISRLTGPRLTYLGTNISGTNVQGTKLYCVPMLFQIKTWLMCIL